MKVLGVNFFLKHSVVMFPVRVHEMQYFYSRLTAAASFSYSLHTSLFAQKEQQARKQTIKATTNKH